jgi:3D (Asp-Asp-Asp) domain-containing protein
MPFCFARHDCLRTLLLLNFCVLAGCDQRFDSIQGESGKSPTQADVTLGTEIGAVAAGGSSGVVASIGNGNLSELGAGADARQAAFRQRFGLPNATTEVLAQWQSYSARLTAYSEKDADWPSPTAAGANWEGTTASNGDPLALAGTTVAVDFSRIPRGSLIYIPALDMYAEANDTGATQEWAASDSGRSDYGSNGIGRVDVDHFAGDRSSRDVERSFDQWIGSNEYANIYVVYRGSGWKKGN